MESGSGTATPLQPPELPPDDVHAECRRQIAARDAEIADLKRRLGDLEARLNQNSRNSSKPPSSDWGRPAPKSQRPVSGRRPGGQAGHPGFALQRVERPDHLVRRPVHHCERCGRSLVTQKPIGHAKRQVFDLPPQRVEVTEYRAEIKVCDGCGHESTAKFPADVSQPAQYGPRIKAMSIYLSNYQFIPYERQEEFFSDLYEHSISQGTLVNFNQECFEKLEGAEARIREAIVQAPVSHHDETSLHIAGKREWLHGASTLQLTAYFAHPKRGKEAMDAMGILPKKAADRCVVHDHLESYYQYKNCAHGLCNAHHLRELTFVEEECGQPWAGKMKGFLVSLKNAVQEAKNAGLQTLAQDRVSAFEQEYQRILEEGFAANPTPATLEGTPKKRGRRKQSKPKNLLDRLDQDRQDVLAFMYDFRVPFDNNLEERDLRMIKAKQKVSGGFRSRDGAIFFCRIRGYISTARKNGVRTLEALQNAIAGFAFIPQAALSG